MHATRKLASFLRPYWLWVVLAPLAMLLEVMMDLLQPWLIEQIIDDGIAQQDMALVLRSGGLMVLAALGIGLVGGMACTVFAVLAAQGSGADLRNTLFGKVQALSFGNLDQLETGKLITRLTNDVTQVQELVMMMLRIIVHAPAADGGQPDHGGADQPATGAALPGAAAGGGRHPVLGHPPHLPALWRRAATARARAQYRHAGEPRHVRVVKAFVRGDHEQVRFGAANDDLMQQNIHAVHAPWPSPCRW